MAVNPFRDPVITLAWKLLAPDLCESEFRQRIESPILSDVLNPLVDWKKVSRDKVRLGLGLPRLIPEPVIIEVPDIILPGPSVTLNNRVAKGKYAWQPHMTELNRHHRLALPAGPRHLSLVCFRRVMQDDWVKDWVHGNGYVLSLIDDLLALGSSHTFWNWQIPLVVALPSTRDVAVPTLCYELGQRGLALRYPSPGVWHDTCHFLLSRQG